MTRPRDTAECRQGTWTNWPAKSADVRRSYITTTLFAAVFEHLKSQCSLSISLKVILRAQCMQ